MRRLLNVTILAITFSCSAYAHEPNQMDNANRALDAQARAAREAEGLAPVPAVQAKCAPLADLESSSKGGTKITKLNAGQYHVMMGIYLGSSITPEGLPPGDGAVLVQNKANSMVFWTRADKEACMVPLKLEGPDHQPHLMYSPMMLPPAIVMALKDIVGGKDEIEAPANDPKDELKL